VLEAPMTTLGDLAQLIRSKNAGPFALTFDIMFDDEKVYQKVKASGAVSAKLISDLYSVPIETVHFVEYDPGLAFKATIPRPIISGHVGDGDIYGAQQFAPLVDVEVPGYSAD
jgi:hypothetical protein